MGTKRYKIFVINLDKSKARWEKIKADLESQNLPYERVSAIDGRLSSDEFLNSYYSSELNRKKYFTPLIKGEIGCYISHLKACEEIIKQGVDYGIIMEDDLVLDDFFYEVPLAINSIESTWNFIKLITPFKKKKIISRKKISSSGTLEFELVRWNKPPMGCQAYAVSIDGARELLKKRSVFFRPIDVDLQYFWETELDILGIVPSMCRISDVESDIGCRNKYIPHYPFARFIYKLKYARACAYHKLKNIFNQFFV